MIFVILKILIFLVNGITKNILNEISDESPFEKKYVIMIRIK